MRVTRDEDKRSLALVLAGALIGFIPAVLSIPFPSLILSSIAGLLAGIAFLLLYGTGTVQDHCHRRRLRNRWKGSLKIGIFSDMPWNLAEVETYSWTDVNPKDWKSVLEAFAAKRNLKVRIELIRSTSRFDDYVLILNPYGGVYPEDDLKSFSTLSRIVGFVREGGIFVNVADVPSYWAYNQNLRRRLEITETYYVAVPRQSGVRILPYKPFDTTPLAKSLDLHILSVQTLDTNLDDILGRRVGEIRYQRAVITDQDSNIQSFVKTNRLTYSDNTKRNITPLFSVRFGEGDFLISLIWINDKVHTQIKKDAIRDAIAKLSVMKLAEKKQTLSSGE